MSRFISKRYKDITPYIPGEQPKDRLYIKLNANETSCEPAPGVRRVLESSRMRNLGRYTEPTALEMRRLAAALCGVRPEEVLAGNGSDEILGWIFQTFFMDASVCYPDITYGFYESLAVGLGIEHHEVPLKDDFTLDVEALCHEKSNIVIANPNAPTGHMVPVSDIERIVAADPNRIVVVDEAYIQFHNESCMPLIRKYDNLIVVHTMSKAYALAGAHIGFAYGCQDLIHDLDCVRGVMNPYNISDITMAVGCAALRDQAYLEAHVRDVEEAREYTTTELRELGFKVLDSRTNFIFLKHPYLSGEEYVRELRERGILVRRYPSMKRAENYVDALDPAVPGGVRSYFMKKKVLFCDYPQAMDESYAWQREEILRAYPDADVRVVPYASPQQLRAELAQADALVTAFLPLTREVLAAAPRLRIVSVHATGYGNVNVDAARDLGIAHVADYCTEEVAEHTMALMLALARHLKAYDHHVNEGFSWQFESEKGLHRIKGRHLMLFGWGRISRRVAQAGIRHEGRRRLAPFDGRSCDGGRRPQRHEGRSIRGRRNPFQPYGRSTRELSFLPARGV